MRPGAVTIRELIDMLNMGRYPGDKFVLRALFNSIICILKTTSFRRKSYSKAVKLVENLISCLCEFNPDVRASCLKLLSTLFQNFQWRRSVFESNFNELGENTTRCLIGQGPYNSRYIVEVLASHFRDVESCARKVNCVFFEQAALTSISDLYLKGAPIKDVHLNIALKFLGDDDPEVRSAAVDIMCIWSRSYPTEPVKLHYIHHQNPHKFRKAQSKSFIKVCELINDSSVELRTKAASLLGCFKDIPEKILFQTLSKEVLPLYSEHLMSSNSPRNSIQTIRVLKKYPKKDHPTRSIKITAKNCPKYAGYCGAFIHGSEDEFEEVRSCTLASMNSLCGQSKEFADVALNHMIDMLNDEAEEIRLNAIRSIWKRATKSPITIDNDNVESFIISLRDTDNDVRISAYKLLGIVKIKLVDIFMKLLEVLIANVAKYKSDTTSIYECLCSLGYYHATIFDSKFIQRLFNLDPRYIPSDARLECDHICKLILIHWAVQNNPSIEASLPAYVVMQLPYIKAKYENIWHQPSSLQKNAETTLNQRNTPTSSIKPTYGSIAINEPGSSVNLFSEFTLLWKDVEQFVNKGLFPAAISTFQLCLNDTTKLLENRCNSLGSLYFLHSYALCCKLMLQIKNDVKSLRIGTSMQTAATIILSLSYTMTALDTGITRAIDRALITARIFSVSAWILVLFKRSAASDDSTGYNILPPAYKGYIDQLINRINLTINIVDEHDEELLGFLVRIKEMLMRNVTSSIDLIQMLEDVINNLPVKFPDIPFIIRRCMTTTNPSDNTNPQCNVTDIQQFPVNVSVIYVYTSTIENCVDISRIAIMVCENNKKRLFWPRVADFSRVDLAVYKLKTEIPINTTIENERPQVRMDLVYCQKPDVQLDISIINEIKNTADEDILKVYAVEDYINVVIRNRHQLHPKYDRCGKQKLFSKKEDSYMSFL